MQAESSLASLAAPNTAATILFQPVKRLSPLPPPPPQLPSDSSVNTPPNSGSSNGSNASDIVVHGGWRTGACVPVI